MRQTDILIFFYFLVLIVLIKLHLLNTLTVILENSKGKKDILEIKMHTNNSHQQRHSMLSEIAC